MTVRSESNLLFSDSGVASSISFILSDKRFNQPSIDDHTSAICFKSNHLALVTREVKMQTVPFRAIQVMAMHVSCDQRDC